MSDQLASVYVNDHTGRILSAWTGLAAQTDLARGDPSYVGFVLNSWYVWIPLCLLFLAPFIDLRRPFRLLHLDLLVLLGFSVSQFFFARGNVGVRCRSCIRCSRICWCGCCLRAFDRGVARSR